LFRIESLGEFVGCAVILENMVRQLGSSFKDCRAELARVTGSFKVVNFDVVSGCPAARVEFEANGTLVLSRILIHLNQLLDLLV
jgi:hypothetical protein